MFTLQRVVRCLTRIRPHAVHPAVTSAFNLHHQAQSRFHNQRHPTNSSDGEFGLSTTVAAVVLLGAGLYFSLKKDDKLKIVHCSTAVDRLSKLSKERAAAIKTLNVVAEVAQEVQPAVVSVTSKSGHVFSRVNQSAGSGFIIDDTGHVVTNAHVVGYQSGVSVNLADGRSFPARVLAIDVSSDLALIQLDVNAKTAGELPHLPLALDLETVRPGQFVLALGSPLMLANTVTVGVVSAVDRDLGHSEGMKYIQTDAIITFGNSGGPLVNLYGEVIGVNAMVAGTGVGFAIPMDQVRRFVALAKSKTKVSQVPSKEPIQPPNRSPTGDAPHRAPWLTERGGKHNEQRRYLGLVMRTLTPELAFELASRYNATFNDVTEGVLVHAVLRDSPAHRGGIQAGDVIVAIDGLPINNSMQVHEVLETRETISITVVRCGQRITVENIKTEKVNTSP